MSPTREEYIAELKSKYRKTGFITTHLMLDVLLHKQLKKMDAYDEKVAKTIDILQELVDKFNVDIWPSIKIKNAKEKRYTTFRFATDSIEFITRVTAGRILMTVSPTNGDYRFVSLLGCDGIDSNQRCGLQGVGGTEKDLCWLMEMLLINFVESRYNVYTSDGVHIA